MSDFLQNIGRQFADVIIGAEIAALQRVEGQMKARIHQQGQASDGSLLLTRARSRLGRYELRYGQKREDAGRRTDKKDLEFTSSLRNGYGLGVSNGRNAMGFFYDRGRIIASGQEQYTRQQIFSLSQQEYDDMMEVYINRINSGLRQMAVS